ncbi:MmgE/PrpD family protein [Pseudonocardia acaciae]|uniref:MmgE/PrpD family protein n=1 Tax=Pseudonocardia acaciae TaxID=551276 RepID=UPI000684EC6D|nr:MmgE/PrpD family protein [Pseudonocardia acaciae]
MSDQRGATGAAVDGLAGWASALAWEDVPSEVAERLRTVLFDALGATALGAGTEDQRALRAAWPAAPGDAPLVAGKRRVDAPTAAFLNAQAMVCLELDEGNKHAGGHPSAHGFPAVLALAAELDVPGPRVLAALLVAYEVSARFGRTTALNAGVHPHGNWGVPGAAAGCAVLLGLDAARVAAAIDAGSGMPVAGHFDSALDGNPVRDAWMGMANHSGIAAARMAEAGVARNTGTAALSLGGLLGEFDPGRLTELLGERYDVLGNYFKRHASCSFTHPAADLALRARSELFDGVAAAEIARRVAAVRVDTHALGAGLNRTGWHNRLSAMFSVPFVVAAALLDGKVGPEQAVDDPKLAELARRVEVTEDPELTRRLPDQRAARMTVLTEDGRRWVEEVPNPVGDSDFHPLGRDQLAELFGDPDTLWDVVDRLPRAQGARELLGRLAEVRS